MLRAAAADATGMTGRSGRSFAVERAGNRLSKRPNEPIDVVKVSATVCAADAPTLTVGARRSHRARERGAEGGSRTHNLLFTKQLLCH